MDWVVHEVQSRAGGQIGTRAIWERVLSNLASLDVPESTARKLVAACTQPSEVALLARLLKPTRIDAEPPHLRALFICRVVDESVEPLQEWIKAFATFYAWLDAKGRSTSLPKAAGYISCCAEARTSGISFTSLADGVRDMLNEYGFDG